MKLQVLSSCIPSVALVLCCFLSAESLDVFKRLGMGLCGEKNYRKEGGRTPLYHLI